MAPTLVLLLAFLIGVVCGLRSLTAPAVVAWAAHRGWIHLNHPSLHFLGSTAAVVVFSLFAVVELVADQLPSAPSRTDSSWSNRSHRSRRIVRSGHRGVGGAIHRDWRRLGCGGRRCRSVWRLPGSHAPGKGAESSGLRDRNIGRRGSDRRSAFHCDAILNRRLLYFQTLRCVTVPVGAVRDFRVRSGFPACVFEELYH